MTPADIPQGFVLYANRTNRLNCGPAFRRGRPHCFFGGGMVNCERIGVNCESAVWGIIRNFAVGNR